MHHARRITLDPRSLPLLSAAHRRDQHARTAGPLRRRAARLRMRHWVALPCRKPTTAKTGKPPMRASPRTEISTPEPPRRWYLRATLPVLPPGPPSSVASNPLRVERLCCTKHNVTSHYITYGKWSSYVYVYDGSSMYSARSEASAWRAEATTVSVICCLSRYSALRDLRASSSARIEPRSDGPAVARR